MSIKIGNTAPKKVYIGGDEVKEVYVGSTKIRPTGWQPGANTLVYYNISNNDTNSTIYDLSGNGNNLSGNISYNTDAVAGKVFQSGRPTHSIINFGNEFTFITRCYPTGATRMSCVFSNGAGSSSYASNGLNYNLDSSNNKFYGWSKGMTSHGGDPDIGTASAVTLNAWYMIAYTRDSSRNLKIYVNGVLSNTASQNYDPVYPSGTTFMLGGWGGGGNDWYGKIKALIGENRTWTAQEIQDYFNLTKADYGIS